MARKENDTGDGAAERDERHGRGVSRRSFMKGAAIGAGAAATDLAFLDGIVSAATNTITTENAKAGSPDWDLPYTDDSIEGFATEYSVNAGETVRFKIRTPSTNYRIDIYRIGWYGGTGARLVTTMLPSARLPQTQPSPIVNAALGLTECGNWAVSASWAVPTTAVSGVYVANLIRLDVAGEPSNRIQFVVRNDGRVSDVLVQTSDTTYQAYNRWGGDSLYYSDSNTTFGRAVKVSYSRPISGGQIENEFFYAELPLVRWLERNGYDVAYTSCIDTERRPAELLKHKVFVSSGHDEYWSGGMRTNVEAARAAGVNLIFMTGNEVFWKVRWENSTDGTGSPYKTMVCYKETLDDAKVDPSSEWTGTWRDPRFSPPSDGGRPENALTGTLFKAVNPVDDHDFAIEVPYEYSQLRFWRNTSVASLAPGAKATLTNATLGYEWNTDYDMPSRPHGLVRLSQTTALANEVLVDHGKTYAAGPLTHYLTTYRHSSGALVWSTGTVQWSWGLDDYHTNRPEFSVPVDLRIQQATLNMLADMGVQPATRQIELMAASASADTSPPVSSITSPAAGANVPIGTPVTITGTATDAGGGVIAAVEVSVDGGTSWHPAIGREAWAYTFLPLAIGTVNLKVRAIDDSYNVEPDDAGIDISAVARTFPGSIWNAVVFPAVPSVADATPLELGVKFTSSISGFATGIRFYKGTGNTGTHVGRLWTSTGTLLRSVAFDSETATGWQTALFADPVALDAGAVYVASYSAPAGHYAADTNYFATAYDLAPLTAIATGNGVFSSTVGGFPTSAFGASNYWVDVMFDTNDGVNPTVAGTDPAANVSQVAAASTVAVTFSESMSGGSIVVQLDGPGGPVTGTTAYDAPSRTATFTPSAPLQLLSGYTATVAAGTDTNGNGLDAPHSWTFTTSGAPGTAPTAVWTSADRPTIASVDDHIALELGLKFLATVDGFVTAIRFFKGPANPGPHVGHLWTLDASLLATVTFQDEGLTGWQEAALATPVALTANTPYVVSYHAPNGGYAADGNYFAAADTVRGPLHALAAPSISGNGVFVPGSGFPNTSYNSTNYWVDVVFSPTPDATPPVVVSTSPAVGIQGVAVAAPISATFDEAVIPAATTFTVRDANGGDVPGTLSHDVANRTATFQPSAALQRGQQHTASVSATNAAALAMTVPYQWSFTTDTAVGTTPATIWDTAAVPATASANDTPAVQLGVKFACDVDATVTAIRFYKGAANAGPHFGHLWTAGGTLLGTVAFIGESLSGWQQANFAAPIPISAGQTYVASYFAPTGRYAVTIGGLASAVQRSPLRALADGADGGNGVFRYGPDGVFPTDSIGSTNYWVDVVVNEAVRPTVADRVPAAAATGVDPAIVVRATFSEAVRPDSIVLQLRDSGGALVAGSVAYDVPTRVATLTPAAPLALASVYTASVAAATDLIGNTLVGPVIWSFTTVPEPPSIQPLIADATEPAVRLSQQPNG